ncbi:MAG TPA: SIMPL domain-containing protein [Candidatus Paceibacterota bacterium]|nr:SIMPL domain-containing protein [Candidatus Paceibacterota bacterium]
MNADGSKMQPLALLGYTLGASIVIAALIAAGTVLRVRAANDVVSVTGSAKMEVTSDQAKWTTQITRTVHESTLKSGYSQLANDLALVTAFFAGQHIDPSQITVSPVSMFEVYQQNQAAEKIYTLSQTIIIQSNDIQKLTEASKNVGSVINQGVIFSTTSLEYYYSKLPDARIALLSQAIDDAKARATELAKNSGKKVGTLKSASSGVVQVQSLNSTDVSDYGSYDTSQIQKQITVTVKASFALK